MRPAELLPGAARRPAAACLGVLGAALLLLNALGAALPPDCTRPWPVAAPVPGYHMRSVPVKTLAQLHPPGIPFDLAAVTQRVFAALQHAPPRRLTPAENWLLWLAGCVYPPAGCTQNPKRILAGGAANCAEAALVLKAVAEQAGCSARFVVLEGHTVLEVHTGRGWQVADPDFGFTSPLSCAELETGRGLDALTAALRRRGFREPFIQRYRDLFLTTADNRTLPTGAALSPRLHLLEQAAETAKWSVPLFMLAVVIILRYSHTKKTN